MTVNQLVDLLAGYIAAGHGTAEVLVSMAGPGEVAGDAAYNRLSTRDWTVTGAGDETHNGFVRLDLGVTR